MYIDMNHDRKVEVEISHWPQEVVRSETDLVSFLHELKKIHDSGSVFCVVKPFCDEIASRKCRFPLMLGETLYDENCATLSIEELIQRGREFNFCLTEEDVKMIEMVTRVLCSD
jgi:hypothetical protein